MALLIAGVMNFFSYWFSDKIVIKMYGGQEVTAQDDPELYRIGSRSDSSAGLPMPRVYIIASGDAQCVCNRAQPEHAAVAVTQGIRRILNTRELAGVLGHELTHVKTSRYSRQYHCCDLSRRNRLSGANGPVGGDLRWRGRDREEGGGIYSACCS